jgi:hypothetical protein
VYPLLLLARLALAVLFPIAAVSRLFSGFASSRKALVDFGVPQCLAAPISIGLPCTDLIIAYLLLSASSARTGAVSALALPRIFKCRNRCQSRRRQDSQSQLLRSASLRTNQLAYVCSEWCARGIR